MLSSLVVLPISSRGTEIWPLRLSLAVEIGRSRTSYVVLPGIRQISKTRLHERIVTASEQLLHRLDEALRLYLF